MQNESANFEFLIDQLREITAERNNLRGLVDDVNLLHRQLDLARSVKIKAFNMLKERAGQIEALKHALEIQAENYRKDTEALRQQIPNPNYVSTDSVAKNCQDIHTTLEIDRLQNRVCRYKESAATWQRRCREIHTTLERVRLENERLKLELERAKKKEDFLKAMES